LSKYIFRLEEEGKTTQEKRNDWSAWTAPQAPQGSGVVVVLLRFLATVVLILLPLSSF